jgi:hypothetical protein
MKSPCFANIAIVSCGTLSLELNHLRAEGFLDTEHLFFTTPGLHEDIHELERQLLDRIAKARRKAGKVLVVYGGKFCYVNADEPTRTMQQIITEQGAGVARIQATHCMDMLASEAERERIAADVANGEKVWWMTPGWIKFRHKVFKGGTRGWPTKIFPGIPVAPWFWMESDIWKPIWPNTPKHFWSIPTGWASPLSPIQLPLTALKCCLPSKPKNCTAKACRGDPNKVTEIRSLQVNIAPVSFQIGIIPGRKTPWKFCLFSNTP